MLATSVSNVNIPTRMYSLYKKSKLKSFLLADSTTIEGEAQVTKIADGSALLWCCNCKRNKGFESIFGMYANFLQFLEISTAAFGGYSLSTKDATHKYVPERQVQLSK